MRAASADMWAVSLAAVGGVAVLLRPAPAAPSAPSTAAPAESVSEARAAEASFGERCVIAYLGAGPDSDIDLADHLTDTPELPATNPAEPLDGPVVAVGVERIDAAYWAVAVAAGQPGDEQFWWVGVVRDGQGSSRRGRRRRLPGCRLPIGRSCWWTRPEAPPVGDPAVDTFAGGSGRTRAGRRTRRATWRRACRCGR